MQAGPICLLYLSTSLSLNHSGVCFWQDFRQGWCYIVFWDLIGPPQPNPWEALGLFRAFVSSAKPEAECSCTCCPEAAVRGGAGSSGKKWLLRFRGSGMSQCWIPGSLPQPLHSLHKSAPPPEPQPWWMFVIERPYELDLAKTKQKQEDKTTASISPCSTMWLRHLFGLPFWAQPVVAELDLDSLAVGSPVAAHS